MRITILIFPLLFLFACSSGELKMPEKQNPDITREQFEAMNWEEKVNTLTSFHVKPENAKDKGIFDSAINDSHERVNIAVLEKIRELKIVERRSEVEHLIRSPTTMVRYHAFLTIISFPHNDNDLKITGTLLKDPDWMIRERALINLRKFSKEKQEKKYFFTVLFMIKEKNINVLNEIYKTLIWYDDQRAHPYMIKRSYIAKDSIETIIIMRHLAALDTPRARKRITIIRKTNKDPIVTREADKLLEQ